MRRWWCHIESDGENNGAPKCEANQLFGLLVFAAEFPTISAFFLQFIRKISTRIVTGRRKEQKDNDHGERTTVGVGQGQEAGPESGRRRESVPVGAGNAGSHANWYQTPK